MGDVLLALAAPFFHGFQTAKGFRHSLDRLETMIRAGEIKRVLAAHHPPLDAKEALKSINDTRQFLNEVETATLASANSVDFPTLWKDVCKRMNKQLEFRGFAMLQIQVEELAQAGKLRGDGERIIRI
jgi:hypothetical protein